jgi:hypothetical protein
LFVPFSGHICGHGLPYSDETKLKKLDYSSFC